MNNAAEFRDNSLRSPLYNQYPYCIRIQTRDVNAYDLASQIDGVAKVKVRASGWIDLWFAEQPQDDICLRLVLAFSDTGIAFTRFTGPPYPKLTLQGPDGLRVSLDFVASVERPLAGPTMFCSSRNKNAAGYFVAWVEDRLGSQTRVSARRRKKDAKALAARWHGAASATRIALRK